MTHHEQVSQEEQQKLLEKYDPESNTRFLSGWKGKLVFVILLSFSLFQVYTAIQGQYTAYIQRSVHLGFALALIFLLFPARRKSARTTVPWYDWILAVVSVAVGAYWPIFYDKIVSQVGRIDSMDFVAGMIATILVLEGARRAVGLPIVIIAGFFIVYAIFGQQMPGFLQHRGVSLEQLITTMFFTTDGILGTPLGVSATFIFLFLLFAAFLMKTGVGNYFNDLAVTLAGKSTGGPAKVAIFSSALQGTISGSSVANVVGSGSYTIPMMKRLGYKKEFAGGVEAAASTGGQLMPPIMGAAAFLMIEFIGIDYWEIAKAATIPALLYFSGIWIMVHFEAKRVGLRSLTDEEMPDRKIVLKQLYLLIPIIAVIVFLFSGMSVTRAALWSIVVTIAIYMLHSNLNIHGEKLTKKKFARAVYMVAPLLGFGYFLLIGNDFMDALLRGILVAIVVASVHTIIHYVKHKEWIVDPKEFVFALVDGARTALGVAAATACAGIIVGIVVRTGLGLSLANELVELANNQLLLTLFFTMIASIILGMGSPTTANYIITSTIAAPAIIALGVQNLSAHMFVFYFGIVADITPPVALAAFAAAGVSGGEPIRTGVNASKLAIGAFIIPYMFVMQPQLLMIEGTWYEIAWATFTALSGMILIGAGIIGFWFRKLIWVERIVAAAAGLLLIYPGMVTDTIGFSVFIVLILLQIFVKRKGDGPGQPGVLADH